MKGQISFDVLLTGVVLVIFFGSLLSLADFLGEKGKISTAREQEREILAGIAGIITNAKTIADGEQGSKITLTVPELIVPGEQETCTISFNTAENKIAIAAAIAGQSVSEERNVFFDGANLDYSAANCGEEITIEKR